MATNEQSPQIAENGRACIKLESVDRISKLPVVESTYQMGKSVYDKVKDYNSVTNWTMSTAENTVCKAVQVGKPYAAPIVHSMEGPLKRVDGMLCTGLDYVESKVPAVKLPPTEVYNSTKDYIDNSPTVQSACSMVKPAVATAKGYAEPVMEAAKHSVQEAKNMVEPAIKSAKQRVGAVIEQAEQIVEPYIGSPKDKAAAIKEYLHPKVTDTIVERDEPEEDEKNSVPCTDCSLEVQKR